MFLRGENKKMEQYDLISFTSVISSLLLCKRVLNASEIVNFISELSCEGMEIDDDFGSEVLFPVVYMDDQCSFGLNKDFSYEDVLPTGETVKDFLESHTDARVMSFIHHSSKYEAMYLINHCVDFRQHEIDHKPIASPKMKKKSFIYSLLAGIH